MKDKKPDKDKKMERAAKAIEALVAGADLTGHAADYMSRLEALRHTMPQHEVIIDRPSHQSPLDIVIQNHQEHKSDAADGVSGKPDGKPAKTDSKQKRRMDNNEGKQKDAPPVRQYPENKEDILKTDRKTEPGSKGKKSGDKTKTDLKPNPGPMKELQTGKSAKDSRKPDAVATAKRVADPQKSVLSPDKIIKGEQAINKSATKDARKADAGSAVKRVADPTKTDLPASKTFTLKQEQMENKSMTKDFQNADTKADKPKAEPKELKKPDGPRFS